jgi:hypothetical protein
MLSRNALTNIKQFEYLRLPNLETLSLFANYIAGAESDFPKALHTLKNCSPNLTSLNLDANPLVDAAKSTEMSNQDLLGTEEHILAPTLLQGYIKQVKSFFPSLEYLDFN